MIIEFTKDYIDRIKRDEEAIKLENFFTDKQLIELTNSNLDSYLSLYTNNYIKAIDHVIDDLYIMYTESVKTRYLLIATCTYRLLKHYESDKFVPFQNSYIMKDINADDKPKLKSIVTFFKEVSNLEMMRIEQSNEYIIKESSGFPSYISEYIINLTEELFFLMPVKMSKGFKELNYKILQSIK